MKRIQPLHANDGRKTDWAVVCIAVNGMEATAYAPSWKKACDMVDIAIKSGLVVEAYARDEETGETYPQK